MKKLFVLLMTVMSMNAMASLEFQMENILGDWEGVDGIFRIQKQTDYTIKVYMFCEEEAYRANRLCKYQALRVYRYQADLDGFFINKVPRICSEGLQISAMYPTQMLRTVDPYWTDGDCGVTGSSTEFRKQ